ncbi:S41 family peptidase [Reichenbachiella sp. MALMAid0571]|uniref:S41 family peptidase n=1 Tax=Reichenbachiella sp. MALMAid0571 TaxID=3143939 RepID=UPI0032DFBAD4
MRKFMLGVIASICAITLFSFSQLSDNYFQITRNLDIFSTLFKELNANYVDDLDSEELVVEGIDAMLESLDPYTDFIPESELESYRTSTTGEYGGIGAIVGKKKGVSTVVMPYMDFPAYKAGLRIGDEILKIDGEDLSDLSTSEVSEMLKGKPNTTLTLLVQRYGTEKPFEVTVERAKITINNVTYAGMYDSEIGVIRLSEFTTHAGSEVADALNKLKEEGATKIILDLRGNPGGLLNEAVNVSNVFIPKGKEIVSTKGKSSNVGQAYKALQTATDAEIPIAVLISNGTASAAEIVSGSIQDYDRGVLIGKKTYGKGLVQGTRQLPYDAQLKLTTAKYYIPSGRCIQAIDYTHRNPDGSVGKIPDSLKVAFKTQNGRTVYDGGGIDPDIPVEIEYYSNLLLNFVNQNILFDYATKYHYEHAEIPNARKFELSDEEYMDFTEWAKGKDLDFSSEMDRAIEALEKISKNEKYYNGLKDQIDKLKNRLENVRVSYLIDYKEEVKVLLEEEIVSRYYLHTGVVEASLDHDPAVVQAVEVLKDQERYNKLLAK